MITWLSAFLFTQIVEMPIWLIGARKLDRKRAWLIAFGTSAITHPVLWFAIPWDRWPYVVTLIGAELLAIVVEALFAGRLGLPRPWQWAIMANAASVAIGFLSRWWFGWP